MSAALDRTLAMALAACVRIGSTAGGSRPRRYSRSRSPSEKARPLLYLGLRMRSTPETTLRTQGVVGRAARAAGEVGSLLLPLLPTSSSSSSVA